MFIIWQLFDNMSLNIEIAVAYLYCHYKDTITFNSDI